MGNIKVTKHNTSITFSRVSSTISVSLRVGATDAQLAQLLAEYTNLINNYTASLVARTYNETVLSEIATKKTSTAPTISYTSHEEWWGVAALFHAAEAIPFVDGQIVYQSSNITEHTGYFYIFKDTNGVIPLEDKTYILLKAHDWFPVCDPNTLGDYELALAVLDSNSNPLSSYGTLSAVTEQGYDELTTYFKELTLGLTADCAAMNSAQDASSKYSAAVTAYNRIVLCDTWLTAKTNAQIADIANIELEAEKYSGLATMNELRTLGTAVYAPIFGSSPAIAALWYAQTGKTLVQYDTITEQTNMTGKIPIFVREYTNYYIPRSAFQSFMVRANLYRNSFEAVYGEETTYTTMQRALSFSAEKMLSPYYSAILLIGITVSGEAKLMTVFSDDLQFYFVDILQSPGFELTLPDWTTPDSPDEIVYLYYL